jgi:hypothetical protein
VTFRLRIPGRDDIEPAPPAKPANLLIDSSALSEPQVSGLAGLADPAANDDAQEDGWAEGDPSLDLDGTEAVEWDDAAEPAPWTPVEAATLQRRKARIACLGHGAIASRLAEMLVQRDRDEDDRRLCVECAHIGPGWRCARREAVLVDQLQRCPAFASPTG